MTPSAPKTDAIHRTILNATLGSARRYAQIDACEPFAAALHATLQENGLDVSVWSATFSLQGRSELLWSHAIVKVGSSFYDSHGLFDHAIVRERQGIHHAVKTNLDFAQSAPDFDARDWQEMYDFCLKKLRNSYAKIHAQVEKEASASQEKGANQPQRAKAQSMATVLLPSAHFANDTEARAFVNFVLGETSGDVTTSAPSRTQTVSLRSVAKFIAPARDEHGGKRTVFFSTSSDAQLCQNVITELKTCPSEDEIKPDYPVLMMRSEQGGALLKELWQHFGGVYQESEGSDVLVAEPRNTQMRQAVIARYIAHKVAEVAVSEARTLMGNTLAGDEEDLSLMVNSAVSAIAEQTLERQEEQRAKDKAAAYQPPAAMPTPSP